LLLSCRPPTILGCWRDWKAVIKILYAPLEATEPLTIKHAGSQSFPRIANNPQWANVLLLLSSVLLHSPSFLYIALPRFLSNVLRRQDSLSGIVLFIFLMSNYDVMREVMLFHFSTYMCVLNSMTHRPYHLYGRENMFWWLSTQKSAVCSCNGCETAS
jgi:hypothetical protein